MRRMTAQATFPHPFVLENERTALRGMTLQAGLVMAQETSATAFERLGKIRSTTLDRISLVRVMAIGTTDFALEHGMVMRQLECRADFSVALEAGRGRFSRIDNRAAPPPAGFDMKTAGTVT